LEYLYAEFIDLAKLLVLGVGGMLLFIFFMAGRRVDGQVD
jgi:hypothetical protein